MASVPRDLTGPELDRALAALGAMVAYPEPVDLAVAVAARLRESPLPAVRSWRDRIPILGRVTGPSTRPVLRPLFRPAWSRVAVALVVLVAVLSGTLALSPGARRAVAGWLGLRGVRIEIVPTLPPASPLGSELDLGTPVSLVEAQALVPYSILLPADARLGAPDAAYLRSGLVQNQLWLVYRSRPGIPRAPETGVGVLFSEFRGEVDEQFTKKLVQGGTDIRFLTVNGGSGFWLSGAPHVLMLLDDKGRQVQDRVRLVGNVLLWEQGGLTLRIESNLPLDEVLRIASSVGGG